MRAERRGRATFQGLKRHLSANTLQSPWVILPIFATVFTVMAIVSLRQKSATWDEPIHLTAGYVALAKSDYRVEPTHPPFLRMWAALPLLAMKGVNADASTIEGVPPAEWMPQGYGFAHRFLYLEHDADRLLYAARAMTLVWGLLLGILIFFWVRDWLGPATAVLALAFYTIEPNIAAHGRLVTTDFGVTCFIFGAIYFLWRSCRRLSVTNLAGLTLFTVLAVVSKFSAVLLGPIVIVLLGIAVALRVGISAKRAVAVVMLLALASVAGIWAIYGMQYAPSTSQTWLLSERDFPVAQERVPTLSGVVGWIDRHRLLPNAFTQGFFLSQATSRLSAYFAGEVSAEGWWYYFPAAFLVKTPSVLIALFFAGVVLLIPAFRRHNALDGAFIVIPIAVYMGFAMESRINIGLRHILPVYPFVLLAAAAAAKQLMMWRPPVGRSVMAVAGALWLAGFAMVYPHTLTFFNVFAGGPGGGLAYLSDSNIDWGQDLKPLKSWMERKNLSQINLAYFGTASPDYYGITCTHLPGAPFFAESLISRPVLPGYVAISSTILSGVYLTPDWRLFYRGFLSKKPVATIGNSIHVYWVESWPDAGDDMRFDRAAETHAALADRLLFGLRWPDLAAVHYQKSLDRQPTDAVTLARLGLALFEAGETVRAIDTLDDAVRASPSDDEVRSLLASALLRNRQVAEAEEHARQAVTLREDNPVAHDVLGVVLAVTGRTSLAMSSFKKALQLAPDFEDARFHLERLEEYLQKPQEDPLDQHGEFR